MLKNNSFRPDRYLRSRFVEGRFLLASEASDVELEVLDSLRKLVRSSLGDVAVADAWKVERLNTTQLLIKPGEAWFKGLPFIMRSGKDALVSGTVLAIGTVPVGVTILDDSSGLGKILTFNDSGTTPTDTYRIVLTASEEIITNVEDPFLKNANISESTALKVRLLIKINVVSEGDQTESPTPYTNDTSDGNLINQIVFTPGPGDNGELIQTNLISGSEVIDGRDLELIVRNDPGVGGGNPIPNGSTDQQAFFNGRLIDSQGNEFHVNAVFNDTISTRVVIRIDKEPDQPNPVFTTGVPVTLKKKDVYYTDDINGNPQGKLFYPIATTIWDSTDGFVHDSVVTDLRTKLIDVADFEEVVETKLELIATGGGQIAFDIDGGTLTWSSDFDIVNPSGPTNIIEADTAYLLEGGTLSYTLDLVSGGAIERSSFGVTTTSTGSNVTLSGSPDLSTIRIGNVLVIGAEAVQITSIDDVNDTLGVDPPLVGMGSGNIYLDSFAEGTAPLDQNSYTLATLKNGHVLIRGLELAPGESNTIYDERTLFPSGLTAGTNITLPVNSRNSSLPQYYDAVRGNLEVYVNQLFKFQGQDWTPVDNNTISFTYNLSNDSEVHFRIDSLPFGSAGGGNTSGTLQGVYDNGNSITTVTGTPVVINGTPGDKLLVINGDMTVTGVIDPTAIQLTPVASNPLSGGQKGLWVSTTNELMFEGSTSSNISTRLDDLESGTSNPIVAGTGLTKSSNTIDINATDASLTVGADSVAVHRDSAGALTLSGSGIAVNTDNTSIEINTNALRIASGAAGAGLAYSSGVLSVNPDNTTLETNSDQVRIKDAGVDENKIATSVAGSGLTGGAGSPLSVNVDNSTITISTDTLQANYTPLLKKTFVAGESYAANTTFLVRIAVNGETAGTVYKANSSNASTDLKFWVIGLVSPTSLVNATENIDVTLLGTLTLGSLDTPFSSSDIGKAIWLTTSGGFSVTAPTTTGTATMKIGIVLTTNQIFVESKQLTGVN